MIDLPAMRVRKARQAGGMLRTCLPAGRYKEYKKILIIVPVESRSALRHVDEPFGCELRAERLILSKKFPDMSGLSSRSPKGPYGGERLFVVYFVATYAFGIKPLWTIWLTNSLMAFLSPGLMAVNSMFIS